MNSNNQTSPTLLGGLRAQDADSWRRLTELYGPTVYLWLRRLGLREEDTPDIVQEVFQAVFVSIERFRKDKPTDRFRDWLYTITKRRCYDHLRKNTHQPLPVGGSDANLRMQEFADPYSDDSSILLPGDEADVLRRALAFVQVEFEERTWQACFLTSVEDKAPSDVAADLGMSIGRCFTLHDRACSKRLRKVLEGLL